MINNREEYQKISSHAWRNYESRIQPEKNRNYLIEEINRNELISKKRENVSRVLNYIDQPLIVISTNTGCVSISAFASLVDIPIEITSSTTGLKCL